MEPNYYQLNSSAQDPPPFLESPRFNLDQSATTSRDDSPDSRSRESRPTSTNRNPSKSRNRSLNRITGEASPMGMPSSLPYPGERGRSMNRAGEETSTSERSPSTARAASRARQLKEQAREQKIIKAREKEVNAQEALAKKKLESENGKSKKVKVGPRASLSCNVCRRRKVRCTGEWPVCGFCKTRELPCSYDGHPAEFAGTAANTGGMNSFGFAFPPPAFEPTLPPVNIILDGLDHFLRHYYDTFYFLHRPSLAHSIQNGTAPNELIFSILALAARFSQPLQDLHPWSVTAASEHFYENAKFILNPPSAAPSSGSNSNSTSPNPEAFSLLRCQCMLILGLYECTSGLENNGWMSVGTAIRICQILRLGLEDDDEGSARHNQLNAVVSESRRRTYWSVFLVERFLTDGKDRPVVLKATNSVRMPGGDLEYAVGTKAPGSRFDNHPPPWTVSSKTELRVIEPDLYGYLIRAGELWANVASFISGNLDRRAPWVEESGFFCLERDLRAFENNLPPDLRYSMENLLKHSIGGKGKAYGLLQILFYCSNLVLHRHYLPFSPPKDFDAANGPIDGEPIYGSDVEPQNWWIDCLSQAVVASVAITDICSRLEGFGDPLTHPFAGYAVLAAGTLHLHLKFWPQSYRGPFAFDAELYINQDFSFLSSLIAIYPIANVWCEGLQKLHSHYHRLRSGDTPDGEAELDAIKLRSSVVKLLRTVKEEDVGTGLEDSASPEPLILARPKMDETNQFALQVNPFDTPFNAGGFLGFGGGENDLNFDWPQFQFMTSPSTFVSSPPASTSNVMW